MKTTRVIRDSETEAVLTTKGRLIQFEVGDKTLVLKKEHITFSASTLNEALQHFASLYEKFNRGVILAKSAYETAKTKMEIREAQWMTAVRIQSQNQASAKGKGTGKLTEKDVQARVMLLPDYQKAMRRLLWYKEQADIAVHCREVLSIKLKTMLAFGDNVRAEIKGSLRDTIRDSGDDD